MTTPQLPTTPWMQPDAQIRDWASMPGAAGYWVAGQQVGPFLLKRPLGQGGMGLVWLAEQQRPFVREVAIKVMLDASQDPLAEAYFQVERQALAQLSHRAIAQIYDAGRLPDGALFFAMEYVPGLPLHRFLETRGAGPELLAQLLIEVCHGIQHAHQRGLIHRDIKPGNILVHETDGVVQPKIIDFGIAIGTDSIRDASSRMVRIAGTDAYMSPEQKRPGPGGIDARSDVYALGAVLAECLYQLAGLSIPDDYHLSTVWRDELRGSLAAERRSEATSQRLAHLPAELRAIALKAMAESREARYDSAAAMAEDLRRWLAFEPVLAMRGGRAYALRRFLRRNALASAAGGAMLLALVAGVVLALYGLGEARAGRAEAVAALQLAEQRRNDAESLVQFMLGDLGDRLRSIGRLDLLDAVGQEALAYLAKEQIDGSEDTAVRRAQAYRTIAGVQISRDQFDAAEASLLLAAQQLQPWIEHSAVPQTHSLASDIAFRLGRISLRRNEVDAAERQFQEHLTHARKVVSLSTDPSDGERQVSNALLNLGALETRDGRHRWSAALAYFDECIRIKARLVEAGSDSNRMELANAWSWKATVYSELGHSHQAWASQRKAIDVITAYDAGTHADSNKQVYESEIRFQTAQVAMDLGWQDQAREQIARALDLAEENARIDASNVAAQRRLARNALHAVRMAADASTYARWHGPINQCLQRDECAAGSSTQAHLELQALDAAARWHASNGQQPDNARMTQVLQAILSLETPSVDVLVRALELADILKQRSALSSGQMAGLRRTLDAVAPGRRGSLRYALAKAAYWRIIDPSNGDLARLEEETAARRIADSPAHD